MTEVKIRFTRLVCSNQVTYDHSNSSGLTAYLMHAWSKMRVSAFRHPICDSKHPVMAQFNRNRILR